MTLNINTIFNIANCLSDFDFHKSRSRFVAVQRLSNAKGREEELKVCSPKISYQQVFKDFSQNYALTLSGDEREDEGV